VQIVYSIDPVFRFRVGMDLGPNLPPAKLS
jgi:hypothetical protein